MTVDGRDSIAVDLEPAEGADPCVDGRAVRLWRVFGNDAAVSLGSSARVVVLDVGDVTVAIEAWGDRQDTWLPLADEVLATLTFSE